MTSSDSPVFNDKVVLWTCLMLPFLFFFNCQLSHDPFIENLKLQSSWIFPELSWRFLKDHKILNPEVFYSVCLSASFSGYGSKFSELQNPFLCDSWYQCFWHLFFIQCVCHLLWHGAEQFTVTLNGLSVVFIWTFSPVLYVFFFFLTCLCFWGILVTNFLISSYFGNAEMGDCKIRALVLFSFCVFWNISALSTYQVLRPTT